MKKIFCNICTVWVMVACLTLTSCKKWLNTPNPSAFDSETTFANANSAEMAVLGAYTKTFDRDLYYRLGMGTDICISTEGIGGSKWLLSNYEYSASIIPDGVYNGMYSAIEYANVCIKNLKVMTSKDSSEEKKIKMLLGECYAIRAMSYFNVVRYWGDVPYSITPVAEAKTLFSSRVSRDSIYDGCVADLQKAVQLLPWYSSGMIPTPERFSKNAAYGILARIALTAAGYSLRWDLKTYAAASVQLAQRPDVSRIKQLYQIASDACTAVMSQGENSLLPKFETVFRNLVQGKYDNETMLEYGQYGNDVNSSNIGYTNGMFSNSGSMYGKAAPLMGAIPTLWYDYQEGDTRRDVTIANYGITATNVRQMNPYGDNRIGKFRVTWMNDNGFGVNKRSIDWPWLRYSDILLMYAEAQNELFKAPTPTGIAAYEKVRIRAFGGDVSKIGTTPTDYLGFRAAIINERKLEFAFEGLRRTDLVRWGVLYDTVNQAKQNVLDMANHAGRYANIDVYRAYKQETASSFDDPIVGVPYIGFKTAPSKIETDSLSAAGYVLLNMYTGSPVTGSGTFPLQANAPWVTGLFQGLKKNQVECLPLSTSMMDNNMGLQNEQQPMY
ncbi:RagB/SusD family nutrient uptake outer membrane protein [Arachidicoccus soli]|uniref:RagB/SusD family nutrient uptake outer membrane protein n=1 Tax=Arachidicoccus soli TaxID=2341117 RepID=A0A386HPL2_9BACT|nr:RagB/SusD family nutrient uptake outer membrane protein [Arachidicoccus soli]AYD47632.1 RagB/SusD family nutrient uptake outer membrane protein [Arachidicoccus soli]